MDYREKRSNEFLAGFNSSSPRDNNLINPSSTFNSGFYSNSSREKFYNPRDSRERDGRENRNRDNWHNREMEKRQYF